MSRTFLSDREVALIKGLITHKGLNDQEALSIFSYLRRNINHREISSIRRGTRPRYVAINAATRADVDQLLYDYARLEVAAAKLGLCHVDEIELQAHKSVEIMRAAITAYNSATSSTRSETFIVMSVIAWTYAFHAALRKADIEPVYLNDNGEPLIVDGQPKLWDLSRCLSEAELKLSDGCKRNIRYVLAVRHAVEHRSSEDINDDVQAKIQANVLNFLSFVTKRFGAGFDFSRDLAFSIQLQALTLKAPNAIKGPGKVSTAVAAVNAALEAGLSDAEFNDPDYAFRVYVVPKVINNSKKADQAVTFSPIGSNVEVAIKQVERPKYFLREGLALLQGRGIPITRYQFITIFQQHDLKAPNKGLGVQLGAQWFWYAEGLDKIAELFAQGA